MMELLSTIMAYIDQLPPYVAAITATVTAATAITVRTYDARVAGLARAR